jgi:hypothetical protein
MPLIIFNSYLVTNSYILPSATEPAEAESDELEQMIGDTNIFLQTDDESGKQEQAFALRDRCYDF